MRQVSEQVSSNKLSSHQRIENTHHDIIKETRKTIKQFTREERFKKAKRHLLDALDYKHARNDVDTNHNCVFQLSYHLQTSLFWKGFLFVISFLYMYLIIGEPTNRLDVETSPAKQVIALEIGCLLFFWIDIVMEIIHKASWKATFSKKFTSRFWMKLVMHVLFLIDATIYYSHLNSFPLRPFRFLRPFLPYLYDQFARNILKSIILAYKDILAYFIFYAIAIFAFGAIGSIIIRLPPDTPYDPMQSDYSNFFQMSFLMYVVSSYDTYPDYQMVALKVSIYYYIFWITFIFMNALFFINIPNTFIFMSFKKFRSKQILIDEIRQQTSLVLSFICLGQQHLSIPSQTFHQFMLFFYKNKLRLIDHIKQLSFKLDQNNNQQIFISDFLKICKLIENDEYLEPPLFPDWEPYFTLRNFLINSLKLKEIVDSYWYEIIIGLFVIGNFVLIICAFVLEVHPTVYTVLESIFIAVYLIDISMRVLVQGIEQFFANNWNSVDLVIILISLGLFCTRLESKIMLRVLRLIRILRCLRITRLLGKYEGLKKSILQNTYGKKIKILFTQLYVAIVVGFRIFPLFCTVFYVFGIIGMEFLSFNQCEMKTEDSPYSTYSSYSSFQNFIDSQLISIQIIIESGWSFIVFDYAHRFNNRVVIFLFFILQHAIIVQVLSATMKGLVGDLYDSVAQKIRQIEIHQDQMIKLAKFQKRMKDELFTIKFILSMGIGLTQDTLQKKEIYENVIDKQLMVKLRQHYQDKQKREQQATVTAIKPIGGAKRGSISAYALESSLKDFTGLKNKLSQIQEEGKQDKQQHQDSNFSASHLNRSNQNKQNHSNTKPIISASMRKSISKYNKDDIDQIYQSLLGLININSEELPCPQAPLYPKFLIQFFNKKFVIADQLIQHGRRFDMTKEAINTPQSISFYINQLQGILSIKKPEDAIRKQIRQAILKLKTTSNEQLQKLLNKQYQGSKSMSVSNILRNVFLMGVNKDLVQKFEVEYFSDIYGESFKQMNRMALEPLLKHESLMIHTMAKLFKYPEIETQSFFNILATIEENISKTLVKKGSIFKFVFEVAELAHNWFAIQVRKSKQLRIHFLKTGIWTYLKTFKAQKIYYAEDVFHFNPTEYPNYEAENCEKTIRLLYNNFQSLGFSLLNSNFFTSDPSQNVYDVYNMFFDCNQKQKRFNHLEPLTKPNNQIKISKIMVVILSKQNQRAQKLSYKLSMLDDVIEQHKKQKVQMNFTFNQAQASTFAKLQNMAQQDNQKISQSQGLPFAFIVDMMKSIKDVMRIHKQTLVTKVQQVFNKQFNRQEQKRQQTDQQGDNIFKGLKLF